MGFENFQITFYASEIPADKVNKQALALKFTCEFRSRGFCCSAVEVC